MVLVMLEICPFDKILQVFKDGLGLFDEFWTILSLNVKLDCGQS